MGQDQMEKAERFQRLFVAPMVDAVREEMRMHLEPLVQSQQALKTQVDEHEAAITSLKSSQKKALAGWGVLAVIGTAAVGGAWDWVKKKLNWS